MKEFLKMLASWGRVFLTEIIIKFMELGADIFTLNHENGKYLITAGVISLLPVILRALNPNDEGFGITKK